MQSILLLLICFTLSAFSGKEQDTIGGNREILRYDRETDLNPVVLDPEIVEDYRKDRDFAYLDTIDQDNWWTRFKRWLNIKYENFLNWLFGDYEANTVIAFLLKILPYFIIGAILGFVVWLFIRLDPGNTLLQDQEEPEVFLDEEEKIIRSQNIRLLIEKAIEQGNFRLAIRYYYLQLLKELNKKDFIHYESQKTNTEYLNEVKREDLRQPLKNLIRIYNFSWYGGFSISENHFRSAQQSFEEMENLLKENRNE